MMTTTIMTILAVEIINAYTLRKEMDRMRENSDDTLTSPVLYSAPKKYFFAPTTKHNGAQKSKKVKK
jgi:hypothetical protein